MERRDQQDKNLHPNISCDTHSSAPNKKHNGRAMLWPNRWERIGSRAQNRDADFDNLMHHINIETLREAFQAIDGTKATGIDGITKAEYRHDLEENLKRLALKIQNGSYKPQPKREVLIPKSNGKMRPIAIACFEDKLVDWVVSRILTIIFEPLFIRNSFGFRPNKSAHEAIKATYMSLKDNNRPYVVEIDFANFFNTIPHKGIMKALRTRITDRKFKGLIGRFLKCDTLTQVGSTTTHNVGTPQGGIMSPILANIYLNEALDQWFIENYASYTNVIVRYADDAVFFFAKQENATGFLQHLQSRVTKFGLTLNLEKTKIVDLRKSENNHFDFLGFTTYWGEKKKFRPRQLKLKTKKDSLLKQIQEFEQWIKAERNSTKLANLWQTAKAKLQGHYNYFGVWTNGLKLWHYYHAATRSLFKWLNRRSQKRSYSWETFLRKLEIDPLPLPPETQNLKFFGRNIYA